MTASSEIEVLGRRAGLSDADAHMLAAQILDAYRAEVEAAVRAEVAADFKQFGTRQDWVSYGEAVLIAREGLCQCRGGSKPCDDGGAS